MILTRKDKTFLLEWKKEILTEIRTKKWSSDFLNGISQGQVDMINFILEVSEVKE